MTPTLTAILGRKRVTTAASRRRPPRTIPQAAEPRAIMRGYTSTLHGIVDELAAETAAALRDEGVRVDAADGDLGPRSRASILERLQALSKRIVGRKQLVSALEGVSAQVTTFSREQFSAQVKAGLGIDLASDPDLRAAMTGFRTENVSLIKSLCREHVSRVRRVLDEAGSGTRVEDIAKSIREATGASKSRAALIGRTEVLKLNAQVTEKRHLAAGIVEYEWATSRDERVRPGHRKLEGTRQRYDAPPVVDPRTGRRGHPGSGDFNCRCTAMPVLPDD